MLLLSLLLAAGPSDRVLVHHDFYPGFMGPRASLTTYTLTLSPDGGAALAIISRDADQRRRFNPTGFSDAGVPEVLQGRTTGQGRTFTATFPVVPGGDPVRDRVQDVVLRCETKTEVVHVAGARVEPPRTCSPCYERCAERPVWTPPGLDERVGVSCRVVGETGLGERAFFTAAGDVERVRGATDCPPEGLRVQGPPRVDWSVFPEGSTVLRDVTAEFRAKVLFSQTVRTIEVTRKGKDVEVRDDGVMFPASERAFSCWNEKLTLSPTALQFAFGDDACDGHEERPMPRGSKTVNGLRCLQLTAEGWIEPTLVFVPGRVVERVDVNTGCTKQRAVRAIPSLETPTYAPFRPSGVEGQRTP